MWGLLKFTTMLGIKQHQVYHGSGADLQLVSLWGRQCTLTNYTHSVLWLSIITPTVMKKHLPSGVIPIYSAGSRPVEIRWEFRWEEYSSGNIHDCVCEVCMGYHDSLCVWVTALILVSTIMFQYVGKPRLQAVPNSPPLAYCLFTCTWGEAGSETAC